ncbi:Mbov_0400 family ICE element protein [Mycoplasma zalophidermidis]|uniref:Uncharacterized protein n=1 Tax=Mycoplasma zalophidermidis TaxID=398174 RepID=A0ABS6DR76_9MOLU|nr:hypothetical protein [Mycoplasma zalophidermidis]MBU4693426.1 hypothetical protein [Mycoplasma zalophidermidis]MCR8966884.1 hypothetical protein [Mycoplasma zalophidermidis]
MRKFKKLAMNNLPIINFDRRGLRITGKKYHPVVVFYTANDVWYLNSRSLNYRGTSSPKRFFSGEIKLIDNDGYESLVDLTSIQVMDKKQFHSYFAEEEFTRLDNLIDDRQCKEIITGLFERINDGEKVFTIQRVNLDFNEGKCKVRNEIIFSKVEKLKSSLTFEESSQIANLKQILRQLNEVDEQDLSWFTEQDNVQLEIRKHKNTLINSEKAKKQKVMEEESDSQAFAFKLKM